MNTLIMAIQEFGEWIQYHPVATLFFLIGVAVGYIRK